MKKIGYLVLILLFILILGGCDDKVNVVIDVTQFSRLTENELVNKLGEPTSKEKISFKSANGNTYDTTIYYYNDNYEFMIIDDKVVRFTTYDEIKCKNDRIVLKQLGINVTDDTKKIVDNGVTLRYSPVSDKVGDVWLLDIENKTCKFIKITYDLRYFQ